MYLETVMPQPGAHGTVYDDRKGVDGMQPKHHWKYSGFSKDIYLYAITSLFRVRNENIDAYRFGFTGLLLLPIVFGFGNGFSDSFQIPTLKTKPESIFI